MQPAPVGCQTFQDKAKEEKTNLESQHICNRLRLAAKLLRAKPKKKDQSWNQAPQG